MVATCAEGSEVAEITDLVDLSGWPEGTRAIARREDPRPGAQLTFTDVDGHRFQVFITDLADDDIAYLEAVQRGRGRAEKLLCNLKDTGLTNLPSADMGINAAWMTIALTAHDLLAWTRLVVLDGDLARAEPKRLRYRLLHAASVIARSGRRTRLRLAANLAVGARPRRRLQPREHAATPDLTPPRSTGHRIRRDPAGPTHRRNHSGPKRARTDVVTRRGQRFFDHTATPVRSSRLLKGGG
jgi:hypothetical protein